MALKGKDGGKCTCNWGVGIIGAIVLTAGIYFLIWGINQQWNSGIVWDWFALLYYLVAIILFGVGKASCYRACGSCEVHGAK